MPYPKDHKAKTRERILEAARVLFNRHGYDRVTIDQIMAAANLTRGDSMRISPARKSFSPMR